MTVAMDALPKHVKALPEEAQRTWVDAYNKDFAWRAQESHAEKAAWRAVYLGFEKRGDTWVKK